MVINVDKTKTMIISSSNADSNTDPGLVANGEKIQLVDAYKFLGPAVDNGLWLTDHVKNILAKTRPRVGILKCMAWKDWGNALETQRTLYLQLIRTCLEYASSSWAPLLQNTNK